MYRREIRLVVQEKVSRNAPERRLEACRYQKNDVRAQKCQDVRTKTQSSRDRNHALSLTAYSDILGQSCLTGGPRAASGPRPLLIRPATTLQRTLFTDL